MFFNLGATNAIRNLGRSLLAILSMAIAASFLSYSVSLEKGYAGGAGQFVRKMQKGEIIAYADKLTLELPSDEEKWIYSDDSFSDFTDYKLFYPEYLNTGYLRVSEQNICFTKENVEEISSVAGVISVEQALRFPAILNQQKAEVSILGREFAGAETNEHSLEEYLVEGSWLKSESENKYSVVVSQYLTEELSRFELGDSIEIAIPRFSRIENKMYVDWLDTELFDFEIVGIIAIPTRAVTYMSSSSGLTETEQIYGYSTDFYISSSLWWQIWEESSNGLDYYPEQLTIKTNNLTYLEDIVYDLSAIFPYFQFISAPKAEERLMANFSLEPDIAFSNLPTSVSIDIKGAALREQQAVISADLRLPILFLILFNAALLVAANILIMVTERKREMAILKAVGAKKINIIIMILAEAVIVTLIGGSFGFLLVEIQVVLNQITNSNPLIVILTNLLRDYGIVVGATSLLAVFFGLLPAVKSASMSVMGVLRDE